jgi:hypothetical protein
LKDARAQKTQKAQTARSALFFCVLCALCVCPSVGEAQVDSAPAYLAAPVSPMSAFFRSLTVPGWGQAKLDRRLTGGIFIAFEGIALGMAVKADRELAYIKARGDSAEAIDNKRQEREDWITLIVFNHLFAALDAFVGSHLYDFPDDVKLRAAPSGYGAAISVPFRLP